uniref:Putative methyltransferase n=2 Tax=viral metagenome TaxID=1070528 RepID=A0A6M3KD49_9ZZZZ
MEITFQADKKHRDKYFTGISFSHPAKMMLPLQRWIVERYTDPGETILDPMAGSGTILIACTMGRHVVCLELEEKFVQMQKGNWTKIQTLGPEMGYSMGTATILQGDARQLEGICDSIISSPPYGNRLSDTEVDDNDPQRMSYRQALGKVDKIITSPPYEEGGGHGRGKALNIIKEKAIYTKGAGMYSDSKENIGEMRGETYLSAMLQVYQECHKVLKPQGLLILVTKNFIRNKQEVRLDEDTIKLCEKAGFTFIERHYRKLTSQSFWRVIYRQKYPDAPVLDKEDILVFSK